MPNARFGTAINCIDGRAQNPVREWLLANHSLDYVDMVTEPGADRLLSARIPRGLRAIKSRVLVSVTNHQSSVVAVVGHHDCAANPVSEKEHLRQIDSAALLVRSWGLPVVVVGLWVNENWEVELVWPHKR